MKINELQLQLQLKTPDVRLTTAGRRKVERKTPSCKTMNPKRKTEAVKP